MSNTKRFVPKYQQVLDRLKEQVERGKPGDRLPRVREMMAEHKVSQAGIERCLDELVRLGVVRRERGKGIFIDGVQPRSNVIGVYSDGELNPISSALFLDGVRKAAEEKGFQVADFGPLNASQGHEKTFKTMVEMGFAGIVIAAHSSSTFFDIESNRQIADLFRDHRLPTVTCRPIPAVEADSVMPDSFAAFKALGEHIRESAEGPIRFLGHQGIPSLARLSGLKMGLGGRTDLEVELLDGQVREGAYGRLVQLKEERPEGSLILGVPPKEPGKVSCLDGGVWKAGTGRELAIVLEGNQFLSTDTVAHVVVKPNFRLGEMAARQVIRRIRGYQGEMIHETCTHEVQLVLPAAVTTG